MDERVLGGDDTSVQLQTPSVIPIHIFDPTVQYNIDFMYNGNQSVANRALITDVDTAAIVYDSTQDTLKLSHYLNADTLLTNHRYSVQIQVFDIDGNSSLLSDGVIFYCRRTPSFFISNDITNVHRNSSINIELVYSQPEGESIKNYQFLMYDYQKNMISSTNSIYTEVMAHTFYGLENNSIYYFRCIGETEHGFELDTGYVEVTVKYNVMPANILFSVNNEYRSGYITLQTNMIDIGYELENDNYTLKDGCLILKENSIKYNNGFTINSDFVLYVEAKQLPIGTFLKTEDFTSSLSIRHICNTVYCEFISGNYVLYCPLPKAQIVTQDGRILTNADGKRLQVANMGKDMNEFVILELKRINNIYSLKAYYKEDYLN